MGRTKIFQHERITSSYESGLVMHLNFHSCAPVFHRLCKALDNSKPNSLTVWRVCSVFVASIILAQSIPGLSEANPIDDGITFLSSTQQSEGFWTSTETRKVHVTAEVLRSLQISGLGGTVRALAADFLEGQSTRDTDALARRIEVLAAEGRDVGNAVNDLVAASHPLGGWGIIPDFSPDPLDTALTLIALAAAGSTNAPPVLGAVSFLVATQNSDGGWGCVDSGPSDVSCTAQVLLALNSYRAQLAIESSVAAARGFLNSKVASNGSIGGVAADPIYTTALALVALRSVSDDLGGSFAIALSFLESQQNTDGSWKGDPLFTAVALRALQTGTVQPPVITSTPLLIGNADELYTYNIMATDPDAGDTLIFSLLVAPSGMILDSGTGLIRWTPSGNQAGTQSVSVQVTDSTGLIDVQNFSITISAPNAPPTIESIPIETTPAGSEYRYEVLAVDPNDDQLTFSLIVAPNGMFIDPDTGVVTWMSQSVQVGENNVVIQVADDGGLVATQSFAISVTLQGPFSIAPDFEGSYAITDLGSIPLVPAPYGGLTIDPNDPNSLLLGGSANGSNGALFRVSIIRDAGNHIVGISGSGERVADAAFNDGGVVFGPGGVLFLARWPVIELGQNKPGSTVTDKIISLSSFGVGGRGPGGVQFVPTGFPGVGQMKIVTWPEGLWYSVPLFQDTSGTFDIGQATLETTIEGGPEGMVYVPQGSPKFDELSLLVSEFSSGNVVAYEMDDNGDPIPDTRRFFLIGLSGAEGAFIDPLSGDFLFSTFGGGNRVVAVRGFRAPSAPVAEDDVATTAVNVPVTIPVLINDSDLDQDPLRIIDLTLPNDGSVINNETSVTFVPDSSFVGTATFTYTVTDNKGGFDTASVTVMVEPGPGPGVSGTINLPSSSPVCTGGDVTLPVSIEFPPISMLEKVDVFFLLDDTGSFSGFSSEVESIFNALLADLAVALPNISFGFGVGRFEDFGGPGNDFSQGELQSGRPFILNQPIIRTDVPGFANALSAGLMRLAPGFGKDLPEPALEALYQVGTGAGFDGDGNGSILDSGVAGSVNAQINPGNSGDVPSFNTNVAAASGTLGGVGFREDALHLVILATESCTVAAYDVTEGIPSNIQNASGLVVPASALHCGAQPGENRLGFIADSKSKSGGTIPNTIVPQGSSTVNQTIEALNALGISVIGLAPGGQSILNPVGAAGTSSPSVFLSALALLTGATNADGAPLVFDISGGSEPLREALVQAIVSAATRPVDVGVRAIGLPGGVSVSFSPTVIPQVSLGQQATFDLTINGSISPQGTFFVEFFDTASNVTLGTVSVNVGCREEIVAPSDLDEDGFATDVDCDDSDSTINPGATEIPGNGKDDDCNPSTPDDVSSEALACVVTTDKISYGPQEDIQVGISLNSIGNSSSSLAGLLLNVNVDHQTEGSLGQISEALNPLAPAERRTRTFRFPIGNLQPGEILASANVLSGSTDVAACSAGAQLVSSTERNLGLTGALFINPSLVQVGQRMTVRYSIANVGNAPLNPAHLDILFVNPSTGEVVRTLTDSTILDIGGTFQASQSGPPNLQPEEYLVVLRGLVGNESKALASASLSVVGSPPTCVPASDPDLNNDGVVNILDISIVASCFEQIPNGNPQCQVADINCDEVVDMDDLDFVNGSFSQSGF